MKTTIVPIALLVLCAISAAVALVTVGDGAIKKLSKRQRFGRKKALTTVIATALAIGTFVPTVAMWPSPTADGPLTNGEGGHSFTAETPDVPMSGDRTNAQLDEFLQEGFGDDYAAVWNGNNADVFMFKSNEDKIKANEAYLQSLGLDMTGFRNGVCFPTEVLTAEVIKNLPNMTEEERAEVFHQHRWQDVYKAIMTIPGFCDMVVQDLEEYDEYVEQNARWLPALKELLAEAKASPDGMYSLLVTEADGSEHYSDAYRYGAAKVCASLENAIIRGVSMDSESIMNWELPSLSPEIQDRWTVKLTEPEDQENLPASIWAFPNVKSGQDAYTDGFNLADLRAEKFAPEKTVVKIDNPDPGTTPTTPTHKVWSHYVVKGTNAELTNSPVYQTIEEGKDWQTTRRDYTSQGYNYNSCSHKITSNGVVTGVMGTEDIHVYFYYTAKPGNPDPVYVSLTVLHVDAHTGNTIKQVGPTSYVQGAQQDVSKESFDGYAYAGYYEVNGTRYNGTGTTVTLNADTTVKFYYDWEYPLTTLFIEKSTGAEVHTPTTDYFIGNSQFTTTAFDVTGFKLIGNSETSGNPKTVTGTMPYGPKTVTFYYEKVVSTQTVTAYYRATDSNRNLTNPITQTKNVGDSYTTDQLPFDGYRFRYTTGDPTSGTVPNRPVEVTYWYEPIVTDGNGNKNPEADPTKTGNANPVKGPDDTTDLDRWQPSDPDTGERVPPQQGNEPTSNHLPTDNQGGQAAGSENRQEVGNNTVNGIVEDNKETPSSGTGGQDPGHVDTGTNEGVKEVEGGGYTPPAKDPIVPDNPPSGSDPVIGAGEVLAEP